MKKVLTEQGFHPSQLAVDELLDRFRVTISIELSVHGVSRLVVLNSYLTQLKLAFRKLQLREYDDTQPDMTSVRVFRDLHGSQLYVAVEVNGLVISTHRPQHE